MELHIHSPSMYSWRGAHLKHRDKFTFTSTFTFIIAEFVDQVFLSHEVCHIYFTRHILTNASDYPYFPVKTFVHFLPLASSPAWIWSPQSLPPSSNPLNVQLKDGR